MKELVRTIDEMIEAGSLLKHPFYQMWSEGRLTQESLAGYSKEYFQLVKVVPSFMDAVMEHAPQEMTGELEENRREEASHVAPWTRFAGSLGVPEDDLTSYRGLEKTRRAISDMSSLMATLAGGACAMYAFEKEIPQISQTKLDGLREFYGMTGSDATEYFELHMEADIRHAASWRGIIEQSDADEQVMLDAAERSIAAQNLLLDGCHEAYCQY